MVIRTRSPPSHECRTPATARSPGEASKRSVTRQNTGSRLRHRGIAKASATHLSANELDSPSVVLYHKRARTQAGAFIVGLPREIASLADRALHEAPGLLVEVA